MFRQCPPSYLLRGSKETLGAGVTGAGVSGPTMKRNVDSQLSASRLTTSQPGHCFLTLRGLPACTIGEDVVNEGQCVLAVLTSDRTMLKIQ